MPSRDAGRQWRRSLRSCVTPAERLSARRASPRAVEARRMARPAAPTAISAASRGAAMAGGVVQPAEAVERLERRQRLLAGASPATPSLSATSRRSISTNRPEIARFDQSALAVVWTSTIQPLPRCSGGDERRAVGEPRPGLVGEVESGSASTWRDTVTSAGMASPANGPVLGNGASRSGCSQDRAPPIVRPPPRSRTGNSGSPCCARHGPAKRSSTPPSRPMRSGASLCGCVRRRHRRARSTASFALQERIDAAAAHLGERGERALEVVGVAEQRLRAPRLGRSRRRCRPAGGASARRAARRRRPNSRPRRPGAPSGCAARSAARRRSWPWPARRERHVLARQQAAVVADGAHRDGLPRAAPRAGPA